MKTLAPPGHFLSHPARRLRGQLVAILVVIGKHAAVLEEAKPLYGGDPVLHEVTGGARSFAERPSGSLLAYRVGNALTTRTLRVARLWSATPGRYPGRLPSSPDPPSAPR